MWIIFDVAVIIIITACTFIGYKQGLVKSAIKILSFFIAIIAALSLYKPVSGIIINNTPIDDDIKKAIIEKITPEGVNPNQEVEIKDNFTLKILDGATNSIEQIAEAFTVKLIEIITILLIYIIAKILLKFVTTLTDLITKLPLLKEINQLGGLIYGIIKGIVLVYTILAVIYLASPLLDETISNKINETIITKILYNNNIILNIIV